MVGVDSGMSDRRCGFTLLEVLLTLCLLVIIMSLTWPVLQGPIDTLRLRRAADEIHAQWASARVEAMDSGRTYMFRYDTAGEQNRFRVECYRCTETADDPVYDQTFDGSTGGLGFSGKARETITGTLPGGVTFLTSATEADTRAAMAQATAGRAMGGSSGSLDAGAWSTAILFYPDGTTSTSVLQLRNEHNRCVELALRGLTGTVTIGEVSSVEGPSP